VQVQALVEADPFWPTGLRKSIQILEWTQVYVDGQKMIYGYSVSLLDAGQFPG
jgi:hypothetical protein